MLVDLLLVSSTTRILLSLLKNENAKLEIIDNLESICRMLNYCS